MSWMRALEPCSRILGVCDFRTKDRMCRCALTDTDFGDRPCPFRKIAGVAAEKYARQQIDAGISIDRITGLTGLTADDIEKIRAKYKQETRHE